jgi:hypothetical protein
VVLWSTSELLWRGGVVSNFSLEYSFMANSLRNDKRYRNFVRDMNFSIQWALHDYDCFAVMRICVQVLTVLEPPTPAVLSLGAEPIVPLW